MDQNQQVPPTNNAGTNPVPPVPPVTPGNQVPPKSFMETLEYYLVTKAPLQLPADIKEMIVRFGPWANLIFLITLLPILLAVLGLNGMFSGFAYFYVSTGWTLHSIVSVATLVLGAMAIPGLFARKMSGWNFLFYEIVVSLVGAIAYGNVFGGILSFIIGAYVLFQVKSYYH